MIVYQGTQIVAHWSEGGPDVLLVSFNQLDSEHVASDHFFLQAQVQGANIACIGVMTTEKNFYRSPEMDEVFKVVAEKRGRRKVVVIGQSMGGYAALKFSRALGADYVIATSPYFSVHPDELELPDDRHRRILMRSLAGHGVRERPEFAGMAIRDADTSGRLMVLYDPAEMIDAYGAGLIVKHVPRAEMITVPHSGHVIFDSTWDSTLIADLLRAVRSPDLSLMARTVAAQRRNQIVFLARTLAKAANRKPRLFVEAMKAGRITRHPAYRDLIGNPFNLRAIFLLAERGDASLAAAHLATVMRDFYRLEIRPVVQPDAAGGDAIPAVEALSRHRCLLMSFHGTFLTWDTERDSARFEPHPFMLTTRLPIVAAIRNGVACFTAVSEGVERPVSLTRNVEDMPPGSPAGAPDEIVAVDDRIVAIANAGTYLGATPSGALQPLPAITHQHRLVVLPLSDTSALFEVKTIDWFDQRLQGLTQGPSPAPVVQRATQRWRKLFKRF